MRSSFAWMWAVALLIHVAVHSGGRLNTLSSAVVMALAIAVIVRPNQPGLLPALAAAQLVDVFAGMPTSPDHWVLAGFVDAGILLTCAINRTVAPAKLAGAMPAARWLLLIAYAAAAVSKYNHAFLDPVGSCATAIGNVASFGLLPRLGWGHAEIAVTLIAETSIATLLLIPRTRRHGVRLGLLFHFALSVSPRFAVVDFTSVLFALFFLFLPADEVTDVGHRLRTWSARSGILRDARRHPVAAGVALFSVAGLLGYVSEPVAVATAYVLSEAYLSAILVAALLVWRRPRAVQPIGRPRWFLLALAALLFAWAASPYLGLRTTSVFTMFSSLRTEGTHSNHLFLPTLHLTHWQDDLVVIDSANSPTIGDGRPGSLAVPLVQLRQLARSEPGLVVVGQLHGRKVTFGPHSGQRQFAALNYWQEKYLLFRPVVVEGRNRCSNS